ncbi:MAG: ATP-dependent DNA ligase [Acidobacteriota bacterium]
MRAFTQLYGQLDATTSVRAKVDAMAAYFAAAPSADAAWGLFFLSGRRIKRLVAPSLLRPWAIAASGLEPWLFEDCYATVGDLAETVSLLVARDDAPDSSLPLHRWVEERLLPLRDLDDDAARQAAVTGWWRTLPTAQVFLLTKMLTGALRVGVSQTLAVRALAQARDLDRAVLSHRLMGSWQPSAAFFDALGAPDAPEDAAARPYPFFLAHPLDVPETAAPDDVAAALGAPGDWQIEWKWDGIRAQLLRRAGATWLWSRGEDLITARFPEIVEAAAGLPDGVVLDGEILAWQGDRPLSFGVLQQRIGRKRLTPKILAAAPAVFLAYDLLESPADADDPADAVAHPGHGVDRRAAPLDRRRTRLDALLDAPADAAIRKSPIVAADASWDALVDRHADSRARGVEGFMVKRRDGPYRVGRPKGDWWKWKIAPLTLDVVMTYAQAGHGRRATLMTDYTFGVWQDERLVTVAKAYSGLDDGEIRRLDRWIRRHTRERFGPVRAVEPLQVFELAFEGIRASRRHKSGVALRFPRIRRWRTDKQPAEADTLDSVHALLARIEGMTAS